MRAKCLVEPCPRLSYGLGLCEAHYYQFVRKGKITTLVIKPKVKTTAICTVDGCDLTQKYTTRGLCQKHYNQAWKREHKDVRD